MPPVIIAAAIAGTAAVGGALISSSAVNSASNAASNAAAQNNALQSQIYQSNKALEQPYIDSGDTANTALQGFLGLGGDPAATSKAFNDYLNSTGYQFNVDQGIAAIDQNKAASGLLNSGSTLKALDAYGTGEAQQYGQQYVGDLQNVAQTGVSATNALAGQGSNYANAVSSNNNSAATNQGNAAIAGANIDNSAISNALKAFGTFQGGSSFGGAGGGANAFTGLLGGGMQPGGA
ncbi:MAG TPA: hypothetical protein VFC47_13825 [Caulobacteraceae bacterium]|nr:hypothetical protein [Caulobacteraceae bacterium]